jgi:hypothetical protein
MDNRLIWVDLDDDGVPELIASDGEGNRILVSNFVFFEIFSSKPHRGSPVLVEWLFWRLRAASNIQC